MGPGEWSYDSGAGGETLNTPATFAGYDYSWKLGKGRCWAERFYGHTFDGLRDPVGQDRTISYTYTDDKRTQCLSPVGKNAWSWKVHTTSNYQRYSADVLATSCKASEMAISFQKYLAAPKMAAREKVVTNIFG